MTKFVLDSRLQADCIFIGEMRLCSLLLMNDQRWPWVILVPRKKNMIELFDLQDADQVLLHAETKRAAHALSDLTHCDKLNIGTIGNVVRQLHMHVVARRENDTNWPNTVWGFEKPAAYKKDNAQALVDKLKIRLGLDEKFL